VLRRGEHVAPLSSEETKVENRERLNRELAAELSEPMIIGVGIHTGDAMIGKMGPPKTPILSALKESLRRCKCPSPYRATLWQLLSFRIKFHCAMSLFTAAEPLAMAPLNAQGLRELLVSSLYIQFHGPETLFSLPHRPAKPSD